MQNQRINPNLIIFILIFIPILLLFSNQNISQPQPLSINNTLPTIGKLFGLIGTILFSLSLILSSRLLFIEKLLNGLDKLYIKHSQMGQISLMMILFHPLLLIPKYADNIHEAASFLSSFDNWANNWGRLSLVLMLILIILTLYLRPKYHIWKFTHKFLTLAFFFASIHVWLVPSDTAYNLPLRIYMLTFIGLAILASLYKTIFGKFLVKKYSYELINLTSLSHNIIQIQLKPLGEKINYKPGQFAFINFKNHPIGTEAHPFSFTSDPKGDYITFTIKDLGDYTSQLKTIKNKIKAEIEGPYGNFSHQNLTNKSQIWIAGGIGITPFISMIKSLSPNSNYRIELFYCVKNQAEAVHLQELTNIAQPLNNVLKITPYFSQQSGRFTIAKLKQIADNLKDKELLICSPQPMITALKKQWLQNNFSPKNYHYEEFNL